MSLTLIVNSTVKVNQAKQVSASVLVIITFNMQCGLANAGTCIAPKNGHNIFPIESNKPLNQIHSIILIPELLEETNQ